MLVGACATAMLACQLPCECLTGLFPCLRRYGTVLSCFAACVLAQVGFSVDAWLGQLPPATAGAAMLVGACAAALLAHQLACECLMGMFPCLRHYGTVLSCFAACVLAQTGFSVDA